MEFPKQHPQRARSGGLALFNNEKEMTEDREGEDSGLQHHKRPREGKYGTDIQPFSQYRKEGI